jgi:hypothetical protein
MMQKPLIGSSTLAVALTTVVIAIGAGVLFLATIDEPYHIDELRQVRSYGLSVGEVIDASLAQEQPPLDSLLNAAAQRVIGVGDVRQRALSATFGVGSLILMGSLFLRAGFGSGSPVGLAVLAVSPALVFVTGYARPYALPLFLMLAFLVLADTWMRRGGTAIAVGMFLVGIALPLSRTAEPIMFLGSVIIVLLAYPVARRSTTPRVERRIPIVAAGTGLVLTGLPVFLLLRSELAEYDDTGGTVIDQLSRLWSEVPLVIARAIPLWPLVLAVVIAGLVLPRARDLLVSLWWFWVILAVPIVFALAFVLRTPVDQPYYERYVFTWIPVLAVITGAVTHAVFSHVRSHEVVIPFSVGTVVAILLLGTTLALAQDLSESELADWKAAAAVIDEQTSSETVIVFDAVRALGLYRTPFAGRPRYTGADRLVPSAVDIARNPDLIPADRPIALMLLNQRPDMVGWSSTPVDDWFTLYVPEAGYKGPEGAADATREFAIALGSDSGEALCLASIALSMSVGDEQRAALTLALFGEVAGAEAADRVVDYGALLGIAMPSTGVLPPASSG